MTRRSAMGVRVDGRLPALLAAMPSSPTSTFSPSPVAAPAAPPRGML
jgi:hypothetical protein